jgi:hypothetical protein
MSRLSRMAAPIAVAIVALVASASAAAAPGAHRNATPAGSATKTSWTARYDASGYYGEVKCTGKTVVNKKYPGGKDIETCEAVTGTLEHMHAGKGQTTFETSEGGTVGEWESDSGDGKRTTDFTYSVNSKLTKFKIIAIYAPPEA